MLTRGIPPKKFSINPSKSGSSASCPKTKSRIKNKRSLIIPALSNYNTKESDTFKFFPEISVSSKNSATMGNLLIGCKSLLVPYNNLLSYLKLEISQFQ